MYYVLYTLYRVSISLASTLQVIPVGIFGATINLFVRAREQLVFLLQRCLLCTPSGTLTGRRGGMSAVTTLFCPPSSPLAFVWSGKNVSCITGSNLAL